jgi:hypothetical protein
LPTGIDQRALGTVPFDVLCGIRSMLSSTGCRPCDTRVRAG